MDEDDSTPKKAADKEKGDVPLTVKEFLEQNHRLFTVIGVFAALSMYLSELGELNSTGVKTGVSASLVLFFIAVSVGVYRTHNTSVKVRRQKTVQSSLRVFPFSAIMYSLVFLAAAVISIMYTRYPSEVGGILTSTIIYTLVFTYWTFVATSEEYDDLTAHTTIGNAFSSAPYVAVPPMVAWWYWRIHIGAVANPLVASFSELVGHASALVILHFLFTLLMLFVLISVDEVIHRGRNWYSSFTPPWG